MEIIIRNGEGVLAYFFFFIVSDMPGWSDTGGGRQEGDGKWTVQDTPTLYPLTKQGSCKTGLLRICWKKEPSHKRSLRGEWILPSSGSFFCPNIVLMTFPCPTPINAFSVQALWGLTTKVIYRKALIDTVLRRWDNSNQPFLLLSCLWVTLCGSSEHKVQEKSMENKTSKSRQPQRFKAAGRHRRKTNNKG